ncbi:MAG: Uncharacterised protein [SAR116 cluster bacterium]|nr:MAG: Uncharacterised protein [SAR116 cluster bacterium]
MCPRPCQIDIFQRIADRTYTGQQHPGNGGAVGKAGIGHHQHQYGNGAAGDAGHPDGRFFLAAKKQRHAIGQYGNQSDGDRQHACRNIFSGQIETACRDRCPQNGDDEIKADMAR